MQLAIRSFQATSLDMFCMRRDLERTYFGRRHWRSWKIWTRLSANGGCHAKDKEEFVFSFRRWMSKIRRKRSRCSERSPRFRNNLHEERSTTMFFKRDTDGSQPSDQRTDDTAARDDFWSSPGNHLCRHQVKPTVKLHVPNEGSFPKSLNFFDVVRRKSTTLDVLLESRTDDYWNVDGGLELSVP